MSWRLPRPWTAAEDKRLLRMYEEGYPRKVIAEALGRRGEAVSDRRRALMNKASSSG